MKKAQDKPKTEEWSALGSMRNHPSNKTRKEKKEEASWGYLILLSYSEHELNKTRTSRSVCIWERWGGVWTELGENGHERVYGNDSNSTYRTN